MKFLRSICCRFDEINPLIVWQLRRYCQPGGRLFNALILFLMLIGYAFLASSSFSRQDFEDLVENIRGLGELGVYVIAYLSVVICKPHWGSEDEMFELTALTRRERCYGNLLLPLFPPILYLFLFLPLYCSLACFGVSFWSLFSVMAVRLFLIMTAFPVWFSFLWFIWGGPRKIRYWESVIWQFNLLYVLFWGVGIVGLYYYYSYRSHLSAKEYFQAISPVLFVELLVSVILAFGLCLFHVRYNLDNRERWLRINGIVYGPAMPLFFGILWWYIRKVAL